MASEAVVRPATPADAAQIAEIWRLGWRDGHLGNVPQALVDARTDETFRTRAAERIGEFTVSLAGDEVAGFVLVADDEVEQVYVSSSHRGTGVARTLLAEAERQVKANGNDTTWLAVVPGNARARAFYERMGWRDEGGFEYVTPTRLGEIPVPCRRYVKEVS